MIDITLRNVGVDDEGSPTAELAVAYSGHPRAAMTVNTLRPLLLLHPGETRDVVNGVLLEISARHKAGEGTPVTANLVDALNLRTLLLALALEMYP
jgi:hypothetical protein